MEESRHEWVFRQEITYTVSQLKGRRLRMVRALTGFSRQEIYDQLGIATSTLDTWESGRVELTEKSAERISEAFRKIGIYCSAEWLLTGNGLPPRMMSDVEKSIFSDNQQEGEGGKKLGDPCSHGIPIFLDDDVRRELNFFMSLHKNAIFHVMEEDFLNSRFKKGDCVAGVLERLPLLEGKTIIAVTDDKKTIPCRLIKSDSIDCEVSFGTSRPTKSIRIVKAAEIIWHRIINKKNIGTFLFAFSIIMDVFCDI